MMLWIERQIYMETKQHGEFRSFIVTIIVWAQTPSSGQADSTEFEGGRKQWNSILFWSGPSENEGT